MSWEESNRNQKHDNERVARKSRQEAYDEDHAMIERRKMHPIEHRRIEREVEGSSIKEHELNYWGEKK